MNPEKTIIGELSTRTCTMDSLLDNEIEGCKELRKWKPVAFCSLNKLWLRNLSVSVEMEMEIYNGNVLSHFLHSRDAIVFKRAEMDQIEAQHRNHLRRLVGVYYPDHIANQNLYDRTGAKPLFVDIFKAQWRLLRPILRLEIISQHAMLWSDTFKYIPLRQKSHITKA
jgi:hypothetical protein